MNAESPFAMRDSPALALRRPGWFWGPAGLVLVYLLGLMAATLAARLFLGSGWGAAAGLSAPAVMATVLTATDLGSTLRRKEGAPLRRWVVGGARAWGAVGAAWPLVWAVMGAPGAIWLEALRVLAGGAIGAVAGAAAALASARLALARV
ncbi:MAG: hypothetical protein KGS44_00920 [Alphaproteobacteria bacterium]|nr:hypothetical protein [Alphaproteobacteria bacterium]